MKAKYIVALVLCFSAFGQVFADVKLLQKQFGQLDSNNDGLLSHVEVQAQPEVIRYMHLYFKDSFMNADINEDGVINNEEFLAFEEDIPL